MLTPQIRCEDNPLCRALSKLADEASRDTDGRFDDGKIDSSSFYETMIENIRRAEGQL